MFISAAAARLAFMSKYPNAFNTPDTIKHLKATRDNVNSAKQAMRGIELQHESKMRFHAVLHII
jgi:hypothetical protein